MRTRALATRAAFCSVAALAAAGGLVYAVHAPEERSAAAVPPVPVLAGELFAPAAAPKPVPELRFVDSTGRPRLLAEWRGRAVLLNLWATWCVPCREEMPALDRLQARLGGPGFEVVALSVDKKGLPAVQGFYAELGLTSLAIYADSTTGATRALGAPGIPTTLLVDAQGRELGRALGAKRWDDPEVIREIASRLGLAPGTAPTPK